MPNTLEALRNRLAHYWENPPLPKELRSDLEDDLREILAHVNDARIFPGEAFRLISMAIGARTGRGEPLDSAWTMNRYGKGMD
jgi:hypothetical protein